MYLLALCSSAPAPLASPKEQDKGRSVPGGCGIWSGNRQGGGIGRSTVTAALKLQALQEVGKAIDRIDAMAEQNNFGFSL